MMNKDQSIVLQVAAKIAADLVNGQNDGDINKRVADWAIATEAAFDHLSTLHGWSNTQATTEDVIAQITTSFPSATVEAEQPAQSFSTGVRVAGKQHGPLPDWLIKAAAAAGVDEVWDNRDQLASNPRRPHFKAVKGEEAFWPPKGK